MVVVDAEYVASEAATARPTRGRIRSHLGISGVVFAYVGRLWWGKEGTGPLLAAYVSLARELPDDTSLLLVGDGPEEARVARMSETEGLYVKYAGFHQKVDLPRLFTAGDVFVLPTLGDPYGLGCPRSDGHGTAGHQHDGVNEYLVPPNDPGLRWAPTRPR
jgi:glycosyltransferase involved in cell wall biosynthesis